MVTLVDALLRDETVLEQDTLEQVLTFVEPSQSFLDRHFVGYGLGVIAFDAGTEAIGASGNLMSYGSDCYYLPEHDITYALLYNTVPDETPEMNLALVDLLVDGE